MNQIKPKIMLDQRKEKRNKRIMLIFSALFFFIVFATQAQMKIQRFPDVTEGKSYLCKAPSYPLEFNLLNDYKDTLSLWAIADSVRHPVYSIMLYVQYTSGLKAPEGGIKIWYTDGSMDAFETAFIDRKSRCIKYNIVGHSLANLFHKEVLAIELNPILYCEGIKQKRYFMDFFALYDK